MPQRKIKSISVKDIANTQTLRQKQLSDNLANQFNDDDRNVNDKGELTLKEEQININNIANKQHKKGVSKLFD